MVQKAIDGVRACIEQDAPIKAGDVVAAVTHGISISKEFEDHLEAKRLTQKYWANWFAEYIVERIYPHAEIKEEGEAQHVQKCSKELAKKYLDEQRKVLESHGDSVVRGKVKDAMSGAQKTFETIAKSHAQMKRRIV